MVKVKVNVKNAGRIKAAVKNAIETAVNDVTDDLVRVSSETAPHLRGILEQSYGRSVGWQGDSCIGTVDYSVTEDNGQNGFDYALWIHEDTDYELGEKSEQKAAAGGGVGMSGKSYPVGNKFLTRPLEGEAATYRKHMEAAVKKGLR